MKQNLKGASGDGGSDDNGNDDGDGPTLRELSNQLCKRIDIGTAILPKPLFVNDEDEEVENATVECATKESNVDPCPPPSSRCDDETKYAKIVKSEFNSVVIEHHLKWAPLVHTLPGPINESTPSNRFGRYDFSHCDSMVDWAIQNGLKVKGHVLCWHVTTPEFVEDMSGDEIREELRRHIYTTVGHFRGRIKCWDVVNEALAPDGSLANNIFLRKLGPSYIEECFRWAHDADPSAFLIYNDNKVEGMDGPNKNKSNGFYNLLADLVLNKKVPIHGAGMQAHFNAGGLEDRQRIPTPFQVKKQIRRLGMLGLKVNISEMDVRVSKLSSSGVRSDANTDADTNTDANANANGELRTKAQCQIYHDIIAAALTEPAFDGLWLWGFSDRHTWVKNFYYDDEPLIFDTNYDRKPSYYSLRDAIGTMSIGGNVGGGVLLDRDCDDDGNEWGHEWMPEKVVVANVDGECITSSSAGDSRPDWLQN